MAKLHEWQKIRKAKRGWVYVATKARTIRAWEALPGQSVTEHRKLRLKRGAIYEVFHTGVRSEDLWIQNGEHLLAIKFEDARLSGGVFPDRLQAEVFKATQ